MKASPARSSPFLRNLQKYTIFAMFLKHIGMKKIVLYCSSVEDLPRDWQEAAKTVGKWIGEHSLSLVYGGVHSGLMRIAAEAAREAGADVVGVVPARRRDAASPLNTVVVPTSDLNDRKGVMQMLGDAFVVLPGGYGTLDEFTTSFSYLNFTRQQRPIIIYNPDEVFDPVLEQLRRMVAMGLMPKANLEILHETHDLTELLHALEDHAL